MGDNSLEDPCGLVGLTFGAIVAVEALTTDKQHRARPLLREHDHMARSHGSISAQQTLQAPQTGRQAALPQLIML